MVELATVRCGGQLAVCEPDLNEGGVSGDWGVVLRCRCGLLSYACAVEWVLHVFHDEGGGLGWNWYSLLLYAVRSFVWFVVVLEGYSTICCAHLTGVHIYGSNN